MRHYAASVGTPSLRTPLPCGFGPSTSFTGGGKYDPEDIRFHVTYSLFLRSASKSSIVQPSTPGPPWFAFTFLNASTTACFGIANGLSFHFGSFTALLPAMGRLITAELPRMSRPLGSRPITSPSQLLRGGPSARRAAACWRAACISSPKDITYSPALPPAKVNPGHCPPDHGGKPASRGRGTEGPPGHRCLTLYGRCP